MLSYYSLKHLGDLENPLGQKAYNGSDREPFNMFKGGRLDLGSRGLALYHDGILSTLTRPDVSKVKSRSP